MTTPNIGYFEGFALRRRAWNALYDAACIYDQARMKQGREAKHGWKPDGTGSEVMFERSYKRLEYGLRLIRRVSGGAPRPRRTP